MLKNSKVVGIAAAITLLTGVALAPSASAVNGSFPSQSLDAVAPSNFDAGDRIDYYVGDVRTGCTVTTTVGTKSKTFKAKQDSSYNNTSWGEVDGFIAAPSVAGEYTVASQVSKTCKDDAGYKFAANMAEDVTVGDPVSLDADFEDVVNTTKVGFSGVAELAPAGTVAQDLGKTKINVYRKGVLVASTTTNNAGEFAVQIDRKHFNKQGQTRIVVKISANGLWYVADGQQDFYPTLADFS